MKKHLNVHIYGNCGAPCPGNTEEDCLKYLSDFYTFLLVFETNVCQHYMSPRLLRTLGLQKRSIIPVVFGGINYNELFGHAALNHFPYMNSQNETISYNRHYTPSIVNEHKNFKDSSQNHNGPTMFMIDALGQSPRALAYYLKHLGDDRFSTVQGKVELSDYLQWKTNYELKLKEWPCLLCETLRQKSNNIKTYLNDGSGTNRHPNKLIAPELCTSWPTLDFSGG